MLKQDHSIWGSVKHFADPSAIVEPSRLFRIDAVVENELGATHLKYSSMEPDVSVCVIFEQAVLQTDELPAIPINLIILNSYVWSGIVPKIIKFQGTYLGFGSPVAEQLRVFLVPDR